MPFLALVDSLRCFVAHLRAYGRSNSVLNNRLLASPRVCGQGAFSGTPGISLRTKDLKEGEKAAPSPVARPKSAKKRSPQRPKPNYGDDFSENKAYRVGGG